MKQLWIIANWKSNKNVAEALDWVGKVGPNIERREDVKVVVCPTFSAIEEVKKAVKVGNFPLMVGSQDLSPFEEGSFTGEEAGSILKQFVDLAILGHSERRQHFAETDEMVAEKVKQSLSNQIIPLVCVQNSETPIPEGCQLVAYEPIFAIGTGTPDTPENANTVAGMIKQLHPEVAVLYGGSATSQNCKSFLREENISGLLIGKASLEEEEFVKIVHESILL